MLQTSDRAWSWTRIDGRNVLATPTRDEIHLYDSDQFILLDKIAPTGHTSHIAVVRWSPFHGRLASLSSTELIVHVPQIPSQSTCSHTNGKKKCSNKNVCFVNALKIQLQEQISINHVTFSWCANYLLYCGAGVGILDIEASSQATDNEISGVSLLEQRQVWASNDENCKIVKFSPSPYVFAGLEHDSNEVKVWRMTSILNIRQRRVVDVDRLIHPETVVYFSWKPAMTMQQAGNESDGTVVARWYEPQRILLTCTVNRTVRIWIEALVERGITPSFKQALLFQPSIPIFNFRWVMPKHTNLSDKKRNAGGRQLSQSSNGKRHSMPQRIWMSGVDEHGILRMWQLVDIMEENPRMETTPCCIKVSGQEGRDQSDDFDTGRKLKDVCVVAYFSRNNFELPVRFDITLQRKDLIILSFNIGINVQSQQLYVKSSSWHRSHIGNIRAIASHPSLPLVASVDEQYNGKGDLRHEILVYWISYCAFSVKSRLIPSGVLSCAPDQGQILCVKWIPTKHFDATPLLMVAFSSGIIEVYGRSANAASVLSSPKGLRSPQALGTRRRNRSGSSPWSFYDRSTRKSVYEFEMVITKTSSYPKDWITLKIVDGSLTVANIPQGFGEECVHPVSIGDELVGVNAISVIGKVPKEVDEIVDSVNPTETVTLRFRDNSANAIQEDTLDNELSGDKLSPTAETVESNSSDSNSISYGPKHHDQKTGLEIDHVSRGTSSSNGALISEGVSDINNAVSNLTEELEFLRPSLDFKIASAGSVSTYGGWTQVANVKAAAGLSLVCICPVYADDGEYIPTTVIIFGITHVPGKLCAWKGVHSTNGFEMSVLNVNDEFILARNNVTSIAGERDYRQRAFRSESSKVTIFGVNSILFIGDSDGTIEHWRCRVSGDDINFTKMSSCKTREVVPTTLRAEPGTTLSSSALDGASTQSRCSTFFRRGYFKSRLESNSTIATEGILHIEVDDPNRIAVLHAEYPEELYIYEGESTLGILRQEERIQSNGRGPILGFCWCSAHVEFNIDGIAVHFQFGGIVIYHFDMKSHRWSPFGKEINTPLAMFDCARDSSALLIGGGHIAKQHLDRGKSAVKSNEMPMVLGTWDEPGGALEQAMDWKAEESQQKLAVWHPYVIVTTLFGMPARVGEKDTTLEHDKPSYEFSKAFKDAVQMLKVLAIVLKDKKSAKISARNGVLSHTPTETNFKNLKCLDRQGTMGRYSTSVHINPDHDKAENLFSVAPKKSGMESSCYEVSSGNLTEKEAKVITEAIDTLLFRGRTKIRSHLDSMDSNDERDFRSNADILFQAFSEEHLLELKGILDYVHTIQSLGYSLDASAADLGAKRYFSMLQFAKSMERVVEAHYGFNKPKNANTEEEKNEALEACDRLRSNLMESPSSGILWALHSDAQQFLVDQCIQPDTNWSYLKPMWLGLWVKDSKMLRGIIEKFAIKTYQRTKDAMSVALFYIALGKKTLLMGLAKMSNLESNKRLAIFLENDFKQERWRSAACKNAFALLKKRNYECAAAFFLLSEPPKLSEALRILILRMDDPSLALVIARLVENRESSGFRHDFMPHIEGSGHGNDCNDLAIGEVTKTLIDHDIIPIFRARHDRWLECAALWWLKDFEQACAILLPQSQPIDVVKDSTRPTNGFQDLLLDSKFATHFYINLTSIPIFFQHLHSSVNSPLITFAMKIINQHLEISEVRRQRKGLATKTDIEHAYSFSAYVCKRSGLNDTSLVEMLQARHLINLHAHEGLDNEGGSVKGFIESEYGPDSTSKVKSLSKGNSWRVQEPRLRQPTLISTTSCDDNRLDSTPFLREGPLSWTSNPRRATETPNYSYSTTSISSQGSNPFTGAPSSYDETTSNGILSDKKSQSALQHAKSSTMRSLLMPNKSIPPAPYLKAKIADMECRRWSSSAFVGKMIGIRVAREMITYFREELDTCFRRGDVDMKKRKTRHKAYLDELCAPLCDQFQLDLEFVLEAALGVMRPHAYLHIVEVCFLLSELNRGATVQKWIQYVALSMLHSCSAFASLEVTDDVYRDWESLTIQLCYILNLDSEKQIDLPHIVVAQVIVAVRTGCVFLSWCRHQSNILRDAVRAPFFSSQDSSVPITADEYFSKLSGYAFETHSKFIRGLQQETSYGKGNFGYIFLGTVASHRHIGPDTSYVVADESSHVRKKRLRKFYFLTLMASILRSLHEHAEVFLTRCKQNVEIADNAALENRRRSRSGSHHFTNDNLDISSSLFTPRKLWKQLCDDPLEGIKRWSKLIESHLLCEFDYSVRDVNCICGSYGFEGFSSDGMLENYRHQNNHGGRLKVREKLLSYELHNQNERSSDSGRDGRMGSRNKTVEDNPLAPSYQEDTLEEFLLTIGIRSNIHQALISRSDDYILLLLKHPKYGVKSNIYHFSEESRIHLSVMLVADAFAWFRKNNIFSSVEEGQQFFERCLIKQKLRVLGHEHHREHHKLGFIHHHKNNKVESANPPNSTPTPTNSRRMSFRRSRQKSISQNSISLERSSIGSTEALAQTPKGQSIGTGKRSGSRRLIRKITGSAKHIGSSRGIPAVDESSSVCMNAVERPFVPTSKWSETSDDLTFCIVDPWDVNAEGNSKYYLAEVSRFYSMKYPTSEVGWDCLVQKEPRICDEIISNVFENPDMSQLWKSTYSEDWLVKSIIQYPLIQSSCCRDPQDCCDASCGKQKHRKIPFLGEIRARIQQNTMFEHVGLPHRYVGIITVSVLRAKDLIPGSWYNGHRKPYVFLEISRDEEGTCSPEGWGVQTYRSRVGDGDLDPKWGKEDDVYRFCLSIPVHHCHMHQITNSKYADPSTVNTIENAWKRSNNKSEVEDKVTEETSNALLSLFDSMFNGPPIRLHVAMYHKTKLPVSHHFLGKANVNLHHLTVDTPMDLSIPLEGVASGSLDVRVELSFDLRSSAMSAKADAKEVA